MTETQAEKRIAEIEQQMKLAHYNRPLGRIAKDHIHWLINHARARDAEIERLRAIVDKLPHTADGVPIVPGMTLWQHIGTIVCEWTNARLTEDDSPNKFNHATVYGDRGGFSRVCMSDVFSTREAALAARDASGGDQDKEEDR